jgi:type IVB pilus formation R64 PilN family outer membrane protein
MRNFHFAYSALPAIALASTLTGCTLTDTASEENAIGRKADEFRDVRPPETNADLVSFTTGRYFGGRIVRSAHGDPLPASLAELRVTIRRSEPIGLEPFTDALSHVAQGLSIHVDGPVRSSSATTAGARGVSPPSTGVRTVPGQVAAPAVPPSATGTSGDTLETPAFTPDFRDTPLPSVLDAACARFDCDWSYDGRSITLSRLITRVFEVRADPSIKQITSEVSGATPSLAQSGASGGGSSGSSGSQGGGESGGGGGSSNQQTSVRIDLDVWKEISDTLGALVPSPGHFVAQRAAGVVTVVAPPATMRRVTSYFEELNRSLASRIAVEITAIYINTDRGDDFGMSLNALYRDAKSGLTYGLADVVPAFNGTIGSANFAVSNPTSEANGTTAVIKALATNNKLADVQTGSIITQNGVPSSLKLTTNTDILRSIQFSTVAQAGSATTAAQATTVPTGFSLQILPRIVGNSDISLIANVENSAISSETKQSVGPGSSIDLLTTTERNFSINVIVGSGEQIASLGYDQYTASRTQSGLGWFTNPFDGEQKADLVRTRLLLILRAVILKGPPPQPRNQPSVTADLFDSPASRADR